MAWRRNFHGSPQPRKISDTTGSVARAWDFGAVIGGGWESGGFIMAKPFYGSSPTLRIPGNRRRPFEKKAAQSSPGGFEPEGSFRESRRAYFDTTRAISRHLFE